jgi:hypothetical protein
MLFTPLAAAKGEFLFDFATKAQADNTYTKHWSNTYPPDPRADIIIFSEARNMAYKRLSALGFVYVVYDPMNNIVAVEKISSFQRNYDPNILYFTLHPKNDWIEGNYNVKIIVFDMVNREAYDENVSTDPFAIGINPEMYKIFYDTGANARDLGVLKQLGDPVARAVLNFQIDKKASIYPPDRLLLHDVHFVDGSTDRILGEKLQVEVKIDNKYKDDGEIKLAMLVDSNIVSTKDVVAKGLNTTTIIFDAKAGKLGTFKLHFGADTSDMKYSNAELTFNIKNESESSRLDRPDIKITGMNIDKEFVGLGENMTISVTTINNGKTGNRTITVYSNRIPVGSAEINLKFLEEKTVEIPVKLETMGINKITVSDAPQLFRNVFLQEGKGSTVEESPIISNPILGRIKENSLKVSMVAIFLIFAGMLFYVRNKLKGEKPVDIPSPEIKDSPAENKLSGLKNELSSKLDELKARIKNIVKKKPGK